MSLSAVSPSPNSVTIDEFSLFHISFYSPALDIPMYWHKFHIYNVHSQTRNDVLKSFLKHIKPYDIIPLNYTKDGESAYFFARNCGPAIKKLCNEKLSVPNLFDKTKPFKLKIVLKYSSTNSIKVDVTENLLRVLNKRFKAEILNLKNFVEDPDLTEFFLLSESRLLAFVLNIAKKLKPKGIKLCNNEIKTLDAFEIFPIDDLKSIDLRNNLICDLDELKYLSRFKITELWLEGNPLCDLYDEYNYVQQVIKYCPQIEKLDGFLLRQNGFPSFRRNFLCSLDAYEIVDQFLEHYFLTYDCKNFLKLQTFYHKEALFSMTSDLKLYEQYSRNLINSSSNDNLYSSSIEIMKLFHMLPRSEHDPQSFTVDVVHYTEKFIMLIVTGIFREVPNIDRILGFNRYFVLEVRNGQYRISNEQMHIFNALKSQQVVAFKKLNTLECARNSTQQNQMINSFAILTDLTKDWAKMFLEQCRYNLKHALILFIDLYAQNKIPSRGFKNFD